jgi:drug/metabolite transporter (DMT)-like permease
MSNTGLAIATMLLSAAMYALSFVLQHKGTQQSIGLESTDAVEPPDSAGVKALIHNPNWLAGLALFVLSFLVHLAALGFGSVTIVQPLIVTELVFIPPFAALISHARISGRDWLAILTVCVGLAVFIIAAQPTEGDQIPTAAQWIMLVVGCLALMGLLMSMGRRRSPTARATLFGLAAGLMNALLALTAKGVFGNEHAGIGGYLSDPLFWLTVLVAVASIGVVALAFRSGPITASTPAMISINPIVSAVAAMWLFNEAITITPVTVVLILVSISVVVAGVFALSKSTAVHAELDELEPDAELLEGPATS